MKYFYLLIYPHTRVLQVETNIPEAKRRKNLSKTPEPIRRIERSDYHSIVAFQKLTKHVNRGKNPKTNNVTFSLDEHTAKTLIECSDPYPSKEVTKK